MLDTFKARLKAKSLAAGANLSQKRRDALADRLHNKFPDLTDEAEHDTAIDSLYDAADLKEFAQMDDYQRTKEAKEKKDKEDADKKAADEARRKAEEGGGKTDDEPAWFKKYQQDMEAKINGLIQEKQQQSIAQKIAANDKLKGIDPKLYARWQQPTKEEEIEAFADEVAATYSGFVQQSGQTGFLPGKGTGGIKPKEGSNEIAKAVVDKII